MSEELENVWKGFVSEKLGNPKKAPLPSHVTADEATAAMHALLPLFRKAPQGWREAFFDDKADADADMIILRHCLGDEPDERPVSAWRMVFERVTYCIAEFFPQKKKIVMRLPRGLSKDDRRTALQLRLLLGQGKSIPPEWPGREGPAGSLPPAPGAQRPH